MKKILLGGSIGIFVLAFAVSAQAAICPAGTVQEDFQLGITVPSNGNTVMSNENLENGATYLIKTSGTYRFANWGEYGIADSEWSYRSAPYTPDVIAGWIKGEGYFASECGLDMQVNGCVDWGDYQADNKYSKIFLGDGNKASFNIYDNVYTDNSGSLNADIYQCVDVDDDNDGVLNEDDKCSDTVADEPTEKLGVNRHIWNSGDLFTTLIPAKRGIFSETDSKFSLEDTYGCSCTQILDKLNEAGLGMFGGHYKFGCSKSVMEEFAKDYNDGVIDGKYLIETIQVPASGEEKISTDPLISGVNYSLKAYGTADAQKQTPHIWFDAECSNNTGISSNWVDGVEGYASYGADLLDLKVNGNFVDWGACDATNHTYYQNLVGDGNPLKLNIYDIYYPNNEGNISVDVYAGI